MNIHTITATLPEDRDNMTLILHPMNKFFMQTGEAGQQGQAKCFRLFIHLFGSVFTV